MTHQERHIHEVFNESEPPYLETDTSEVDLEAGLLQVRDRMNCPKDKAPENTLPRPIAFTEKGLTVESPIAVT